MSEIQNIFCSFQVVQRIFNKLLLDFYVEFKNNKIYAIMFYLKKLSFNYFLIFRIINKICQKPVRETVARFIGSAKVDISFCIGFHYHVTLLLHAAVYVLEVESQNVFETCVPSISQIHHNENSILRRNFNRSNTC